MPLRLLMVNHEFTVSGSSTAFLRLALSLKVAGHAVTLFPVNPADGPIRPRYGEAGIPVVDTAVATAFDAAILSTIRAAPVLLQLVPGERHLHRHGHADEPERHRLLRGRDRHLHVRHGAARRLVSMTPSFVSIRRVRATSLAARRLEPKVGSRRPARSHPAIV